MALTPEKKQALIHKFQRSDADTGSAEVQIAILSERINGLAKHFDDHVKDHHSRQGLLKMVSRRRKLLSYFKKHNVEGYKRIISELGIRK